MPTFILEKKIRCSNCLGILLVAMAISVSLLLRVPTQAVAQAPDQQEKKEESVAVPEKEKNSIEKITAQQIENDLEITLQCANVPIKNDGEVPGSNKKGIFLDISDSEVPDDDISKDGKKLLKDFDIDLDIEPTSKKVRFSFNLPVPFSSYSTAVQGNNVVLRIKDFFVEKSDPSTAVGDPETIKKGSGELSLGLAPQTQDITSTSNQKESSPEETTASQPAPTKVGKDAMISVDFYKVDLHNVFRLLGNISGYNIVVAEGISGSLTLSLKDVPWDFALDIILNLKDLAKEQRYNTIVIYKKGEKFVWPKREEENDLSIEAPPETTTEDGGTVVIRDGGQTQQEPPEAIEAKKFLAQALHAEKNDNLEEAVHLYEKALEEWPDKKEKSKLANKIAAIYLAKLNQNAKAVYFAKQALAADRRNSGAALNAAVGYANMQENRLAQQYFDQSISTKRPSQEALFNYAVFSERLKQYEAALRLLRKYNELYGENLDSMVARARILDQQGRRTEADQAYTAILHAGFSVPQDLRAFILARTRSN